MFCQKADIFFYSFRSGYPLVSVMDQVLSTTMYVLYTEKATILISLLFVDRKSVNLVSDRVFSRDAVFLSYST